VSFIYTIEVSDSAMPYGEVRNGEPCIVFRNVTRLLGGPPLNMKMREVAVPPTLAMKEGAEDDYTMTFGYMEPGKPKPRSWWRAWCGIFRAFGGDR
jgi:hypothetical protein